MNAESWHLLEATRAVVKDEEWGSLTWFAGNIIGNARGLPWGVS